MPRSASLRRCRRTSRGDPLSALCLLPSASRLAISAALGSARSRKDADFSEMRVAGERRPPRPRCTRGPRVVATARHAAGRHGPLTLLPLLRDVNGLKTLSEAA